MIGITEKKKLRDLQSKKNESIHFMPSLIRKLFHKSEAPKDGLTQPQREAIVDLLNYCMYADNLVFLAEDRLITDTVSKFNWDPKVPFDQFDVRSIDNARNARVRCTEINSWVRYGTGLRPPPEIAKH